MRKYCEGCGCELKEKGVKLVRVYPAKRNGAGFECHRNCCQSKYNDFTKKVAAHTMPVKLTLWVKSPKEKKKRDIAWCDLRTTYASGKVRNYRHGKCLAVVWKEFYSAKVLCGNKNTHLNGMKITVEWGNNQKVFKSTVDFIEWYNGFSQAYKA